jgi:hypothetical protein
MAQSRIIGYDGSFVTFWYQLKSAGPFLSRPISKSAIGFDIIRAAFLSCTLILIVPSSECLIGSLFADDISY